MSSVRVWQHAGLSPDMTPSLGTGLDPEDPPLTPWLDSVTLGDCLTLLPLLPDRSVGMVLADLPYGATNNAWDRVIDLPELWEQYGRLIKPGGAIVLTATQQFSSRLVMSKPDWFRYEWIWIKSIASNQLNSKRQPLQAHEHVLVFGPRPVNYYPQMTAGKPYTVRRKADQWAGSYSKQRAHESVNPGVRYPRTVLDFGNPRIRGGHPTQKPVPLFEYLIKTYTTPGEVVLDNVIGSGTTAEAALRTGRHFIGMESDPHWFDTTVQRIGAVKAELAPRHSDATAIQPQ